MIRAVAAGATVDGSALPATAVHTGACCGLPARHHGANAVLMYERVGVGELRRAWVSLDLAWTGALVITALALARSRGTELGVP
jgi:hypothetical protein